MPNGEPRDGFFYPTLAIDSYIIQNYQYVLRLKIDKSFYSVEDWWIFMNLLKVNGFWLM